MQSQPSRKRPREPSGSEPPSLTMNPFPELPTITGDIILETFTHKSLRLSINTEQSSDNERLSRLGNSILAMVVTNIVFLRKPMVQAADFPEETAKILSDENFKTWVDQYGLRRRLRYLPSDTIDLETPEETRALLEAYVGAVFTQSGISVVTGWILSLVDPEAQVPVYPNTEEDMVQLAKRHRAEVKTEMPPTSEFETPLLQPVSSWYSGMFNPDSAYTSTPSVSGSSVLYSIPRDNNSKTFITYLPAFNQRCSKQHLKVEYHAENHGLPHAPRWVIKCFVNDVEKGQGQGTSKQLAKEAAAKMAYHGMGWGDC